MIKTNNGFEIPDEALLAMAETLYAIMLDTTSDNDKSYQEDADE